MASTENEAMKRLRALSECSICLTTYTDPRMLPCFHSACLKCFEDIQKKTGMKPGDFLPCPLCKKEFPIPEDGMKGLQRNFFIANLMEATNAFDLENKSTPCTMCSTIDDANDVAEATMRCLNCSENYCLRCSMIHKTNKATQDHKIVELGIEGNEEEIENLFPIGKCVRHLDKELDYYCSDCKTVVCVSCFFEDHQTHDCKEKTAVDQEVHEIIDKCFTSVNDRKEDIMSQKLQLARKKGDLLAKAAKTKMVIRKKNQQLKALIDQHTEDVLNELSLLKEQQEQILEAEIEEIETKLAILESFMAHCTQLKSKGIKGSPSEVCGNVDKLLKRAKELSKENDEYLKRKIKSFEFKFIATDSNSLLQNAGNIIGKLSVVESSKDNGASNSFVVVIGRGSPRLTSIDAFEINLNRPEDVTFLEPLPAEIQIGARVAAAVHSNSIFVCGLGNKYEEIWRLESTSSKWRKCASMTEGRLYHSAAFVGNVLYICGGLKSLWGKKFEDVETYNTYDDKCSKVGKLSYAVYGSGNCVPVKSSLYIFGGYNSDDDVVSKVQVYDTKLNTCTLLKNQMPRACAWLRGELCDKSVILLGNDGCYIYNIETQAWKVRNRLKFENIHSGAIVNGEKEVVIGCGIKDADFGWISVANILNDESTEWTHDTKLPITLSENVFAFAKL